MQSVPVLTAGNLALPGVSHAFFTRKGGISTGIYDSLNGGVGSSDAPENVKENRRRMAFALDIAEDRFLVPYQIHSAEARIVARPWPIGSRPRCDGLVTNTKSLALGVTGADCGMLLFADAKAQVIGACHAGWKGAFSGMIAATIDKMEACGARHSDIHVALGPTIGPKSYEVGPEFIQFFINKDPTYGQFFIPSPRPDHALFNLPGFINFSLEGLNVASFENLSVDTYSDEARCFSFRRSTHRQEPDYGRLVSAIALT